MKMVNAIKKKLLHHESRVTIKTTIIQRVILSDVMSACKKLVEESYILVKNLKMPAVKNFLNLLLIVVLRIKK